MQWFVVYSTLVFSGPLKLLFHWSKIRRTNLHMFKILDHIFLAFLQRWNTFRFQKIYRWLSLTFIYIYIYSVCVCQSDIKIPEQAKCPNHFFFLSRKFTYRRSLFDRERGSRSVRNPPKKQPNYKENSTWDKGIYHDLSFPNLCIWNLAKKFRNYIYIYIYVTFLKFYNLNWYLLSFWYVVLPSIVIKLEYEVYLTKELIHWFIGLTNDSLVEPYIN